MAKAEKAKESMEKHKGDAKAADKENYYHYKCAKIEWTKGVIKMAQLSHEMGKVRARPHRNPERAGRHCRVTRARPLRRDCTSRTRSMVRTRSKWRRRARHRRQPLRNTHPPTAA